jgi:hypothetical protein
MFERLSWYELLEILGKDEINSILTDPVTISETLITFPIDLAAKIKWDIPYIPLELSEELQTIARDILSGTDNSLSKS